MSPPQYETTSVLAISRPVTGSLPTFVKYRLDPGRSMVKTTDLLFCGARATSGLAGRTYCSQHQRTNIVCHANTRLALLYRSRGHSQIAPTSHPGLLVRAIERKAGCQYRSIMDFGGRGGA